METVIVAVRAEVEMENLMIMRDELYRVVWWVLPLSLRRDILPGGGQ